MSYLLIVVFFLSVYHYWYENVVAPSLRHSLRNKLFVLRDQLRSLKIDCKTECSDEVFALLDSGIGRCISRLPGLSPSLIYQADVEYKNNSDFRRIADDAKRLIDECESEEVGRMYSELTRIMATALLLNAGGWVPYLFPVLLPAWGLVEGVLRIRRALQWLLNLSWLPPDGVRDKLSPQTA